MGIYICDTDNKCGKTVVAAGIAAVMQSLGYASCVYKPVITGAEDRGSFLCSKDLVFIKQLDPFITVHSSYMFKYNSFPAVCANVENTRIELSKITEDFKTLERQCEIVLTEAPGGLMTPIFDGIYGYAIPSALKTPLLFVVNPAESSINSFLNELNTAKAAGLRVKGVIVNRMTENTLNREIKNFPYLIEKYSDAKVLGITGEMTQPVQAVPLIAEILKGVDLQKVLDMEIPKLNV